MERKHRMEGRSSGTSHGEGRRLCKEKIMLVLGFSSIIDGGISPISGLSSSVSALCGAMDHKMDVEQKNPSDIFEIELLLLLL